MTAIEKGIINSTTKTRMAELERQMDELSGKILIEENKLENRLTREDVKEYLTHGVRDLSPQALIELLVHRIELYDDKIIIWFNYSDRTDPDDPDTDRRGLLLSDKYSATATSRFIIIEVNTFFIAINSRKKKTAPIFGTDDKNTRPIPFGFDRVALGGDNRGLQSLRFPWWLRHREPPTVSHRGQIFEVFVYDCSRFYRGGFLD